MRVNKFWIVAAIGLCLFFGIRYLYFKPTYHKGEVSPIFTATLADGRQFAMGDLKGKFVLIDFWGSWCGPCLSDMPVYGALYGRFHNARFTTGEGFEIVGIAVEKDARRWRKALDRLAMPWEYQILDTVTTLRFFDGKLTQEFGVKRLPATFLLDPEGNIVGTDLSHASLEKYLSESRVHPD